MRSRYAAFIQRDARSLFRTVHRDHPSKARGENTLMARVKHHVAERGARARISELAT
jgi:uncharacterized protein YchJ